MDQSRGRLLMGLVLLAAGTLVFDIPSYGDAYKLTIVTYTQDENFYGIDNVGNFVVDISNSLNYPGAMCAGVVDPTSCYETFYVHTNQTVISITPPSLPYDDGVRCTPTIPGFDVFAGACNNGHEIFTGFYGPQQGVWTGPDPVADLLLDNGSFDGGFINHLGDAVFIDGQNNTLDWAEDLTTSISPEPGSLFLVGSGGLMLVACLIRKSSEKCRQRRSYQCPT